MPTRTLLAKTLGLVAAATLAASVSATASDLAPVDQRLDLGGQQGDFYAIPRADGLHVVATFAENSDRALPVRFEAVLAPGQTVTVSSPRPAGEPANSVALTRDGDRVVVRRLPAVD